MKKIKETDVITLQDFIPTGKKIKLNGQNFDTKAEMYQITDTDKENLSKISTALLEFNEKNNFSLTNFSQKLEEISNLIENFENNDKFVIFGGKKLEVGFMATIYQNLIKTPTQPVNVSQKLH